MEGFVYATALGLTIPVLGWRVLLRGRPRAWEAVLLALACWGFQHIVSQSAVDSGPFDPYSILEISQGADPATIRAAYRQLSLRNHPDKNQRKRDAAAKFALIAKAYKTLTDPEMKENWRLHGHPDGPRPYSIDVALPAWIRPGPKDGAAVAGAYLFAYISGFLGVVWAVATCMGLKPLSASKGPYKAGTQDIIALAQGLPGLKSEADVVAVMAAAPGLCNEEREAVARAMADDGTTAAVGQALVSVDTALTAAAAAAGVKTGPKAVAGGTLVTKDKRNGKGPGAATGTAAAAGAAAGSELSGVAAHNHLILLGLLHGGRAVKEGLASWRSLTSGSTLLRAEETHLTGAAEALLTALMHVSKEVGATPCLELAIATKALIRRRLWSHADPDAAAAQEREMSALGVFVPRIEVTVDSIETADEPQIAPGDIATVHFSVARRHAERYLGAHPNRPAERSPVAQGEPWWVVLTLLPPHASKSSSKAQKREERRQLLAIEPFLVEDLEAEEAAGEVRFRVPPPLGKFGVRLELKSPIFIGVDAACGATFTVETPREEGEEEDEGEEEGGEE